MRILVIGSAGQLAKDIIALGPSFGHEIIAPGERELDLTARDSLVAILEQKAPEVVINCAAYNQVDKAEENPAPAMEINGHAVGRLAALCRELDIFLVHYSSDYVFDGKKEDFYREDDALNPINVYGRSKALGEELLSKELGEERSLLLRLSWVFGHGPQNFLYKLSGWAQKQPKLKVVYDQISVPAYTVHIADWTYKALAAGLSGLYHMVPSGYASRYEVARYYFACLSLNPLVLPVPSSYFPTAAERPLFTAMSNEKLTQKLGPLPNWQIGVAEYAALAKKEAI